MNEFYRGRRLRRNPVIREMVRETQLSAADLMMLYFVVDTTDEDFKKEIPSMPGQYQLSLKQLEKTVGEAVDAGLRSLMLFGIPKHKDAIASEAYAPNGIVQRAIRMLKAKWPDLQVVTDVCLCEYTSHGHCGILKEGDTCGEVVNDPTLELLAKTALSHVEAGAVEFRVVPGQPPETPLQGCRQKDAAGTHAQRLLAGPTPHRGGPAGEQPDARRHPDS